MKTILLALSLLAAPSLALADKAPSAQAEKSDKPKLTPAERAHARTLKAQANAAKAAKRARIAAKKAEIAAVIEKMEASEE